MTSTAAATYTIQRVNAAGDDYENVRPASSRSNGRRDVRKLAERTGVAHRLVVGDGWDYAPEVVLVAGDPTAAEVAPVADAAEPTAEEVLGECVVDTDAENEAMDAEIAAEEAAAEQPAEEEPKAKVDHVARHIERTARGPMLQSRYLGQDEWDDVRSWDCLYRGRRGGRGLVKKGMGAQEARLVRQDTGEVIWSSADDPELIAYFAAQDADYEAAAAARVEGSYLGAR